MVLEQCSQSVVVPTHSIQLPALLHASGSFFIRSSTRFLEFSLAKMRFARAKANGEIPRSVRCDLPSLRFLLFNHLDYVALTGLRMLMGKAIPGLIYDRAFSTPDSVWKFAKGYIENQKMAVFSIYPVFTCYLCGHFLRVPIDCGSHDL